MQVAYRREFKRVFGAPRDVTFIDFEGYSRFWNALFAYGPPPGNSSMVVLHNQIRREIDVRLPYLAEIARMYEDFDVVASVADAIPGPRTLHLLHDGALRGASSRVHADAGPLRLRPDAREAAFLRA